jgi:hypothetical protein
LKGQVGQESHMRDTVDVEKKNRFTPEQEELLWWERHEKIIKYHQNKEDGALPIQKRHE